MKNFFKSASFKIILVIIIALIAGIALGYASDTKTSQLTKAGSVIFYPVEKCASFVSEKIKDFNSSFVSSRTYREEISKQDEEIDDLQQKLVDYERTKQKLGAYEEFLDVKDKNPDYRYTSASVISRTVSGQMNVLTLDKGSSDDIKTGDPVVYGENVVGIVRKTTATTCTVRTIIDSTVNISAYEIKSRETGYVSTSASLSSKGQCALEGLSKQTAVTSGGIVCTSGLGGIFPRDLKIGMVTEIKDSDADVSLYAVITPGVDVSKLSDVFIITYFDGQGQIQAESSTD